MSKKSSTFALEMEKKLYIQPTIDVLSIKTKDLMQTPNISDKGPYGGHAPKLQAPVF